MFRSYMQVALFGIVLIAYINEVQAITVTMPFTPGTGESATVAGDPGNNASSNCCGAADGILRTGRPGTNTWSGRSVMRFDDLATLDEEAVINTATLRLYRTSSPEANDGSQRLYLLTSPFSVAGLDPTCCTGDVDNRDLWRLADGIAGTTVGTPFATFTASLGYNEIDVTSIVQNWQANDWANAYGFGLVGVENASASGVIYDGAFSANPIQLLLEVTLPAAPIPEPNTLGLLMMGGALLMGRRRRSRK